MENDQRLTPLPVANDLHTAHTDLFDGYSAMYDDPLHSKRPIRQYFNIVYKRLPIIVAITILVTAAVAIYSYKLPSIYQAQTELILEPRKPQVTQKDAININFGDDQKYYNTQLQLLQNQDLMKRVVIALGLQRDSTLLADQNRGIIAALRSMFSGGQKPSDIENSLPIVSDASVDPNNEGAVQLTPEENARAEAYAGLLAGGLRVEQMERTNIVNVIVKNSNPVLAAKVADKVAELFIAEDEKRETAGAKKAYEDLGASIEDLKAAIKQEEDQYIAEMSSSNLPLQEKGGDLRSTDLGALLTQFRAAQDETTKIQALYSAAANAGPGGVLSVVGSNKDMDSQSQSLKRAGDLQKLVAGIESKINEANEKRQTLLVKYTPEYKDVVAVNAQIKELESQKAKIDKEASEKMKSAEQEVLASLRSRLSAAQQREAHAQKAYEDARNKANVDGVAETKLTGSRREIESNRSLLDTYIQRQKEQELALSSGRPNNIKIQNHAVTPGGPIGPQRTRNILVALLISFAAGIGLAFLLDYLDDSVRTSDAISRHLGLPTLALIPHYLATEKRKLLPAKNGPAAGPAAALITMDERHSPMAEAYRHLRTSLLFSSAGKPPQTILITSPQPYEGKTTTAINTAVTLAQSDMDVEVINCDPRRPRMHSHFGLANP